MTAPAKRPSRREIADRTMDAVADPFSLDAEERAMGCDEIEHALTEYAQDAVDELRNIADADPRKWDEDVRDQFETWAKSRANAVLGRYEADK